MLRLGYLSGIFDHFNQANMKLQGPETTVIDCKQGMNGFCKRLILWCDKIQRCNTEMFPELSEILYGDILSSPLVKEFVSHITNLVSEVKFFHLLNFHEARSDLRASWKFRSWKNLTL